MKALANSSRTAREGMVVAVKPSSSQNFSPSPITNREQEIVSSIAKGLSNKEVASHFGLSESTIKKHLSNIFIKLGARNRVEAVRIASELGLLY